jgi:hypothetical protein
LPEPIHAAGIPCAVKGFLADRRYHFFDKPLGYLGKLTAEDELLYADFDRTVIAVRGVPFIALTPEESDPETAARHLEKVTDLSHADEIFTDLMEEQLAVSFVLPQVFASEAHAWFSEATIIHLMSALMSCAIRHSVGMTEPFMLLNASPGLVELILCRNGQLLFANHYRTTGPADVLYYSLAVLNQLRFGNDEVVVKCSGPQATETLASLEAYLPHTHFFSFPEVQPRSDYPQVETVDLTCIEKCAS